jgi:hypothetical protein
VFAQESSVGSISTFSDLSPTRVGERYKWRDVAAELGLMIALVLPQGQTLAKPEPMPAEAKRYNDRLAAFWLLYPPSGGSSSVEMDWSMAPQTLELDAEVERVNRAITLATQRPTTTDYDIALSFAGEDRSYVEQVAKALVVAGVKVFYDNLETEALWGKNLYSHLSDVYRKRARFTVMFISRWYAEKQWTNFERQAAQARAFAESREYILPARFDDTELPGMLPTTAYVSLRDRSPIEVAQLILKKLEFVD